MTLVDENLDWDYAFTKRLDLKAKIALKCVYGPMGVWICYWMFFFFFSFKCGLLWRPRGGYNVKLNAKLNVR